MRWLLTALLVVGGGCANSKPPASGESDPAADALFHQEPRWQGGDAAFSVDLGGDRSLWMFGDSFIATTPANTRTESRFVRNSVAVQTGRTPTQAAMQFAWGSAADGMPASYFPENGDRWHWPLSGLMIDDVLVLFVMVLHSTPGQGLGFAAESFRAVIIDNPSEPPGSWRKRFVDPPATPNQALVGVAAARDGDYVLAYAVTDGNSHRGRLSRFRASELKTGTLTGLEWWMGAQWQPNAGLNGATPAVVIDDIGPEASVHFDPARMRWVHLTSRGFGATTIAVRLSPKPEGPWSEPADVFEPPESREPKPFVYAGKAHPELVGQGDALLVTYAANSFTFQDLFTPSGRVNLYWPRFVQLRWSR